MWDENIALFTVVVVNDETYTFTVPSSFVGYGRYFKAGDCDQTAGTSSTIGATVKFYTLKALRNPWGLR